MTSWNHRPVVLAPSERRAMNAADDTGPVNVDGPTPRGIPAQEIGNHQSGRAVDTADTADMENPTPATGSPAGGSPRHVRPPADRNAAALFQVYMFPIGHLPVPSARPNPQLPPPEQTDAVPTGRNDVWGVSSDVNTESIIRWLEAMGVPPAVVSVGVEADNSWCLLRTADPATAESDEAVVWDVFWQEHGNRYDWARFSSEQVACHYLFGRLTWAQVARGAVGLVE